MHRNIDIYDQLYFYQDTKPMEKTPWNQKFLEAVLVIKSFGHDYGKRFGDHGSLYLWVSAMVRRQEVQEENWSQKTWKLAQSATQQVQEVSTEVMYVLRLKERPKTLAAEIYATVADVTDFVLDRFALRNCRTDDSQGPWKKLTLWFSSRKSEECPTIPEVLDCLMLKAERYYKELVSFLSKQKAAYTPLLKYYSEQMRTFVDGFKPILKMVFETIIRYTFALIAAYVGIGVIMGVMEMRS